MRRRYDSREMVGMLRAWNVNADVGFARDIRDAVISVDHIGPCCSCDEGDAGEGDGVILSLVDAI